MPIYMDRHDVTDEVTAEIVADLHQKDLKIQHKFNCKGLTYWFDDKRKTAFCLIEAPDKAAIKEMHDKAHGEVPNKIIEVDDTIVESFLGRIEDPEKSQKTELNIINDSAFRTIMVVGIKPTTLKETLDKEVISIIADVNKSILVESIDKFNGRIAKQNFDNFLISFDSVTNAVLCALNIQEVFKKSLDNKYNSLIKLQIGICAGVPVSEKDGFFEDTIKTAHYFFEVVNGTVVLSSEVKDLYENENMNASIETKFFVAISQSEEKFLKDLMVYTEREWSNTSLNADDFSRYLGCSKSQLYRKIIAMTGKSPNSFIREYRLSRALNLFNKNKNISEIAYETGFNSPAYFSKSFQKTFGILPSTYVRQKAHQL
ncbi:MAG: nickel-binding protein [Bacteroidia bacterium]